MAPRERACGKTKLLIQLTLSSFVPCVSRRDQWKWLGDSSGKFSTSSAVKVMRSTEITVELWNVVWFKYHVPRYAFVLWLLCKKRLMTRDRLKAWGVQTDSLCVCCMEEESMEHLFFECRCSARVWLRINGYV
ncbi:hypothetical protein ACH5RR_029112 [Cinchona calisaya]|uniref:Reverse transcriptase zinc-binding domain-containing protein n=1 Tax=Cinchona calisaya TaxID=153742 RepID=A0ABD2YSX9_9GENT